ncbi:EthD family reductase [Pararhodobacter zhoushanensis]|uniref:EthD family reductase n=1 Tax=Pararhodobacter zhoushanensis TaxID=2479545 RepID=A0ABT3H216_9RHOB|nr:EthD family reductase [Pararhodobacter zhoushanensis]MCW1933881.1 EthD family reductase [Pararhodobacter zhoushanensis]
MIIRSALLVGTIAPEIQTAFDACMRGAVIDAIRQYPGLVDVTLRKTATADEGSPAIYMQFDLRFDSMAAMDAALASPARAAVRSQIIAGMADFQGKTIHVVSEILD